MNDKLRKMTRPLVVRNADDAHRAATELELLFDLVFVVAIALAAVGLHHAIAEAHYIDGLVKFSLAFFALWWPWMSHTWFASAFDNDDASYRISVMVMMFGVILIAGSLPAFFESLDIRLMAVGYVVLRIPFIFLWFRAGKTNPEYAKTAKIISWGQILLQIFWIFLAFVIPFGGSLLFVLFALGALAELVVTYLGYLANNPPYHKHHIMERYGLLNIIVLGEVLLSSALAIQAMSKSGHWTADLIFIAIAAVVVPFVLWWLYFNEDDNLNSDDMNHVFVWGYGHYFIFASAAAIGAGFAALVDASGDHPHGSATSALWAISLSVAIYIFTVWLVRDRHILHPKSAFSLLLFAALIALTPLLPVFQLHVLVALLIVTLAVRLNKSQYKLSS